MPPQNDNDNTERTMEQHTMGVQKHSKFIFVLFYAMGALGFIPIQFYITANDYWMYKFRDLNALTIDSNTSDSNKTELQKNFTSYYTIVANICLVASLALTVVYANRISIHNRIIGCIPTMLLLFMITLIFAWIDTDSWQKTFFVISLVIGASLHVCAGCFLLTSFQLSSQFPNVYVGAQISGQSVCGILAALVQILTLSIGASSKISGFIYFLIGALLILFAMVLYMYATIRQNYLQNQLTNQRNDEEEGHNVNINAFTTVGRKMLLLLITMALTSGVTVAINPGMTSLIETSGKGNGRWNDVFFVPVCTYLMYSVWDFIGREVALRLFQITNIRITVTLVVLRIALVPLLMFCNLQPRDNLPVVFGEDYVYIIFMVIFSFTAGYFVNLCIMEIPRVCKHEEKKIATLLVVIVMMVSMMGFSFLDAVGLNNLL